MYSLEVIHAMNAATPGEINAKRVKTIGKYVRQVQRVRANAQKYGLPDSCPTTNVVLKTVLRILRRRKFD